MSAVLRRSLILALFSAPSAALASCPGETLVSCPVGGGKMLELCIGADDFLYRFGPPGRWELELTVPLSAGTVTPWPGIGSTIWSSVGFPNRGYLYEVWISVEKDPDDPRPSAGVNVLKGDGMVAARTCVPGTVSAPAFLIEDAMAARGWCFEPDIRAWSRGACG